METVAVSWLTAGLIAAAVFLLLAITLVLLPQVLPAKTAAFYCPWARRDVQFLTCDGCQPIGGLSYTAFADPSLPTWPWPTRAGGSSLP